MIALAWALPAFVLAVALARPIHVLSEKLPERLGGSNLPDILRWTALPTLAAVGTVAFWGIGMGGGLAGGPPSLPSEAAGPPNAPIINSVTAAGDSVTFRVSMSDFSGSQADTQDSTRVMVDTAGGDFTNPLVDSLSGPQTADTISHGFADGATYDFVALYKGASGGWSDTSSVTQKTVTFSPGQINDLSVIAATDSSLTFGWSTVHNGLGDVAFHNWRCKNITGDTASFSWGGTQEFNDQFFDSIGSSVDESVSREVTGLISGDKYECGILAYRGEPNVDAVYGPIPTSETRAVGTVQAGGGGDPVAPSTPSVSLSATSDTNSIQMTGSGFDGENQTHDSTQYRLSDSDDMSSPFYDETVSSGLTSHLATDNANLDAGATVYGDMRYFASSTGWTDRSSIESVVNSAPSSGEFKEPNGFFQLREWTGTSLLSTGWTEFGTNQAHKHSKVDTAGLPSGNAALYRHTYPSGTSSDGVGTENLNSLQASPGWFPNGTDELYVRFWLRISANWVGHTTGTNKILYFGSDSEGAMGTANEMYMTMFGTGSSDLTLRLAGQKNDIQRQSFAYDGARVGGTNQGGNGVSPSKADATITRGVWHLIEMHFIANSADGVADGEVHGWVDGTKIWQYTSGYELLYNPRILGLKWDAIYGGLDPGGTLSVTQTQDKDDIYISGPVSY